MILFQLRCDAGHRFEGWFRNGDAYEAQAAQAAITCPVCGSHTVEKAPMAPSISRGKAKAVDADTRAREAQGEILRQLRELRSTVESNADYVGDRFAEEARRIHYGEVEHRAIYGETSSDQAEALREEGVPFARIPWVPNAN